MVTFWANPLDDPALKLFLRIIFLFRTGMQQPKKLVNHGTNVVAVTSTYVRNVYFYESTGIKLGHWMTMTRELCCFYRYLTPVIDRIPSVSTEQQHRV